MPGKPIKPLVHCTSGFFFGAGKSPASSKLNLG